MELFMAAFTSSVFFGVFFMAKINSSTNGFLCFTELWVETVEKGRHMDRGGEHQRNQLVSFTEGGICQKKTTRCKSSCNNQVLHSIKAYYRVVGKFSDPFTFFSSISKYINVNLKISSTNFLDKTKFMITFHYDWRILSSVKLKHCHNCAVVKSITLEKPNSK